MNQKQKKRIIALALGSILVVASLSLLMSTQIGGTVWQLDYEITNFTVNGETQGTPDEVDYTDDYDIPPYLLPNVIYKDPFVWWVDIDGDPIFDGSTWDGLLSDVGVAVSLPWRVDGSGEKVAFNYDDPDQIAHNYGDEIVYEFYYMFSIEAATKSDSFIVPPTAQSGFLAWDSCEGGEFDLTATVNVFIAKRAFSNVSAVFADAKIYDVDWIDLQLQSGIDWQVAPQIAIMQDVNTGVPISNRVELDNFYSCDLTFVCGLTAGMVKAGINRYPYDVWLTKTVLITVLMKHPIDIGSTGEGQEPEDPPVFTPEFPLWLLILLAILAVIVIVAIAYIVGKVAPVIAIFGSKQ